MGLESKGRGSESRFAAYVEAITSALGHADRATPFQSYCAGLLLPGDRKSVEPMAARVEPGRVQAAHQSLHHFVAKSDWSDDAVLAAVRARVLPIIEQRGPIRALIIDDTGMPKQGRHSVGVARQYCGQLGKQDNCQVAVSLSAANDHASLPIAYRLYLPHEWVDDPDRRTAAGIPGDVVFQTKPRIALDQLRAALAAGIDAEIALARRGIWQRHRLPRRHHSDRPCLCRRHPVLHQPLAARRATAAAKAMEWAWPSDILDPSGRRASADLRQATGAGTSQKSLAAGHLARRHQYQARLALCGGARSPCASRLPPPHAPPRGMVPDRVACGRTRANKILPVHLAREHQPSRPGQHHQAALADRAGLPGPQAGTRAWPLRGARLAWLSSSRHALHRCLRIPALRKSEQFPPQDHATPFLSKNIPYPEVIDPAAPPIRPERHVANSISSVRIAIARAIARTLPRCPCCQRIARRTDFVTQ